jgi:ubiquinone/menaquinone biosynthesis C-methylase UbiE
MAWHEAAKARERRASRRDRASWLARVYDVTAWYWGSLLHRASYGRAYRRLFMRLGIRAGGGEALRVLDCGIGAGVFSEALLGTLGGPARLFGVDLSPRILRRAATRLATARLALVRADMRALPFGARRMDVVLCGLALDHVRDPSTVLEELARVARPGALVVVVTTRPFAPDFPIRLAFRYWRHPPAAVERAMTVVGLIDIRRHLLSGLARPFGIAFTSRSKGE